MFLYSLGIRVAVPKKPKKGKIGKVYYSVLHIDEDDELEIIKTHYLVIPVSLDVPEQLAFIRTNFLAVIMQYDIKLAGLRVTEFIAGQVIPHRVHIEGVFQELFANSSIENYELLSVVKFAKLLQIPVTDIKACIKDGDSFMDIENWSSYQVEERESIIAATSMFQVGGVEC